MAERKRDPIKRVVLADGRVRYRFVIDVGKRSDGKRDQLSGDLRRVGRAI